jgi:hypothetical protein
LEQVKQVQQQIGSYLKDLRAVNATLDPASDSYGQRRHRFHQLCQRFAGRKDPISLHLGKVMASFAGGLFAGGPQGNLPQDNLDLERWFRLPKGHERRIHGHQHAGVRIVQEGPSLLLALDAHRHHPEPFTERDLRPYRDATAPPCQREAIARRKVMRKARSKKQRRLLLSELEQRYLASS